MEKSNFEISYYAKEKHIYSGPGKKPKATISMSFSAKCKMSFKYRTITTVIQALKIGTVDQMTVVFYLDIVGSNPSYAEIFFITVLFIFG